MHSFNFRGDPLSNTNVDFDSAEDAVLYCERHGMLKKAIVISIFVILPYKYLCNTTKFFGLLEIPFYVEVICLYLTRLGISSRRKKLANTKK